MQEEEGKEKHHTPEDMSGGWLEEPAERSDCQMYAIYRPHWNEFKAIDIGRAYGDRRPETALEWMRCFWNADIFIGPVPLLKLQSLMTLAAALLSAHR